MYQIELIIWNGHEAEKMGLDANSPASANDYLNLRLRQLQQHATVERVEHLGVGYFPVRVHLRYQTGRCYTYNSYQTQEQYMDALKEQGYDPSSNEIGDDAFEKAETAADDLWVQQVTEKVLRAGGQVESQYFTDRDHEGESLRQLVTKYYLLPARPLLQDDPLPDFGQEPLDEAGEPDEYENDPTHGRAANR